MFDDPAWLRARASKCRSLAASNPEQRVARTLLEMAAEYEQRAAQIETSRSKAT